MQQFGRLTETLCYAKRKKPISQGYPLLDSIYRTVLKKKNYHGVEQSIGCQGLALGTRCGWKQLDEKKEFWRWQNCSLILLLWLQVFTCVKIPKILPPKSQFYLN